jgi:hypothetical protein
MVNTWLSGGALGQMLLGCDQTRIACGLREVPDYVPRQMMITNECMQMSKPMTESLPERNGAVSDQSTEMSLAATIARL